MNPPNTIASDTLVEAVARAMADEMKSNSVYVSDDLRNCLIDGGLFDLHGTAQAALTAITDAGYEIAPQWLPQDRLEAAHDMLRWARAALDSGYRTTRHRQEIEKIDEYFRATNNVKAE